MHVCVCVCLFALMGKLKSFAYFSTLSKTFDMVIERINRNSC